MGTAFIFPGQGSQAVGMGKALAGASSLAKATFQELDDILGQPLSELMFEGPEEELTLTANAQPAIMAASIAAVRVAEQLSGKRLAELAACVAGHSLGEYSALCAAGSLSLADTARLLRARGEAMQAAVAAGQGAMAALIGMDIDAAVSVAREAAQGDVCAAANDNAPGQVVLSGDKAAVERGMELAKARGAKRAVLLAVSAPFHCDLMAPAGLVMQRALGATSINRPAVPLFANVTAEAVSSPDEIRQLLFEQVTARVRWRESVENMARFGADVFVEFGGKVVGPMTKRIVPAASSTSLVTFEDISRWAESLQPGSS